MGTSLTLAFPFLCLRHNPCFGPQPRAGMAGEALTQLLLVKLWENATSTYEGAERPEHPEMWEGFSQLSTGSQHSQKRGSEAQNEVSLQPTTSQTIQEYQGSGYSEANQSPLSKMIFLCLFKKKKKKSLPGQKQVHPNTQAAFLPLLQPASHLLLWPTRVTQQRQHLAPTEPTARCIQSSDC